MIRNRFITVLCLLALTGCVSFPQNFPPVDSKEYLVLDKTLTVNNPFNTHYVSAGKYKFSGTVGSERFYRPQDPTMFSNAPMRYLRIDPGEKNKVCVIYADLVTCIDTTYKVIQEGS
jgi:hypothetical protein